MTIEEQVAELAAQMMPPEERLALWQHLVSIVQARATERSPGMDELKALGEPVAVANIDLNPGAFGAGLHSERVALPFEPRDGVLKPGPTTKPRMSEPVRPRVFVRPSDGGVYVIGWDAGPPIVGVIWSCGV